MYLLMYVYVCIEGVNSGFEIGGGGGVWYDFHGYSMGFWGHASLGKY